MKRLLKIIAAVLVLLVALLVVAAIAIPLFVDPNDYRDAIAERVEQQTGRRFAIKGELKLSVFPWLAVETGAMELGNAEGFGPEPFARIQAAELRIRLLPLLRKELRIGTVRLDGLALNLQRDEFGHTNWEDLAGPTPTRPEPAVPKEEQAAAPKGALPLATLAIGGLELKQARLSWHDRVADRQSVIEDLDLESGAIAFGQPFPLEFSLSLHNSEPEVAGRLAFSGQLSVDPQTQRYSARGLLFDSRLKGEILPAGQLLVHLAGDADADLNAQTLELRDLKLTANGAELAGNAAVERLLGKPTAQGRLTLALADAQTLLDPFSQQLPSGLKPADLTGSRLDTGYRVDLATEQAALQGLTLESLGSKLALDATASRLMAQPAASGTLRLDLIDGQALVGALAGLLPEQVDSKALAAGLSGGRLQTGFRLDLQKDTATLDGLELNALGSTLSATADGGGLMAQPRFRGKLRLSIDDAPRLLGPVAPLLPAELKPAALSGSNLQTGYAFDLAQQTAKLDGLRLQTADVDLQAEASAKQIIDLPDVSGQLTISPFSPRKLLTGLGIALPEMTDDKALRQASLTTAYNASPEHVALSRLKLQLDDSSLAGSASVRNFDKPVIRYQLALDELDVDRYLPPQAEQEQAAAAATVATGSAAAIPQLPLELLRSLDIDGTLTAGNLAAAKLRISKLSSTLKAKGGLFRIAPLSFDLYQGSYRGNSHFDVRGKRPKFSTDSQLDSIEVGDLLTDLLGEAKVTGTVSAKTKLNASGLTPMAIRRSLSGTVESVRLENGTLKGINLGHEIRKVYAQYKKRPEPAEEAKQTDFASLTASATITNGLLTNKDLKGSTPAVRFSGAGKVHLAEETLDYRLKVSLVPETVESKRMAEFSDVELPIAIKGSFSDPSIRPDAGAVLEYLLKKELKKAEEKAKAELERKKQEAKEELERKRKEAEEKARQKLEEELKKGLEGLFR